MRTKNVAKYADMFSAMGTEPRLRIMQLLLSALNFDMRNVPSIVRHPLLAPRVR